MPGYSQTLASCHTAGTAVVGTAVTTLLHSSGIYTMPGGSLNEGDEIEIDASGQMNTIVTTPGTTVFSVFVNGVVHFASQAISLNTVAQTNATWSLKLRGVVRVVGSAANILWTGEFTSRAGIGSPLVSASGVFVIPIPDTAPVVAGTTFDSTVSNKWDLQVTNSIAGSIQCMRYKLKHEVWRP